jgi:hypothetical protein
MKGMKKNNWEPFGEHHIDDLEKIKKAAVTHNVNIKLRDKGALFIEAGLLKQRPQNLKLFVLTLEAFVHCREFARIHEELSHFPDRAIARCKAYMDNYCGGIAAPKYFPRTNEEVFDAAVKQLVDCGVIKNDELDELAGSPEGSFENE